MRRTHQPIPLPLTDAEQERLWAKVHRTDGCWQWLASTRDTGEGVFSLRGRTYAAHRIVWSLLIGPIADGLQLVRGCDNKRCVNPAHLNLVQSHWEDKRIRAAA